MKSISTLTSNENNLEYYFDKHSLAYKVKWKETEFFILQELINNILSDFFNDDEWKPLGASMTNPMSNGLGIFIRNSSRTLTPRHASAIAAIMVEEKLLQYKGIKPVWLKRLD